MNPLVQTSNQSPKISDRNMHAMQVGLMEIPVKLGSESLPLCFSDLRHKSNPKTPQNENQKNIKPSSLDR